MRIGNFEKSLRVSALMGTALMFCAATAVADDILPVTHEACAPECADGCDGIDCNSCDGSGHGSCLFGDSPLGEPYELFGTIGNHGIKVGGWAQFGYSSEETGLFTSSGEDDKFNLNQGWIYVERIADGSKGIDWGFRFDVMYGTDAQDTQSFGNDPGEWDFQNGFDNGIYGWALPQLYGEVAYGDLSVKVGHFYTLLGYEVVTAPDNFFFSHSFTMFNAEAFTHTGVLGTYQVSDEITAYAGWTLGWDTGFDQFNNGSSWLGGISVPVGESATLTYISTLGNLGFIGDGYSHSLVLDVAVTDKINYVGQSDFLDTNGAVNEGGGIERWAVGINQYLFYTVNERIKLGGNFEWFRNDIAGNGTNDIYMLRGGVNVRPHANLVLRPEVRYQWTPASDEAVGFPMNEVSFNIDMVLTF